MQFFAGIVEMTTFARLSRSVQERLRKLTPCALRLYACLLERYPAGRVQEVFLNELAEELSYHVRTLRRTLKLLMDNQLVEVMRRYSADVYRLVAHDDRTLPPEDNRSMGRSDPPFCCGSGSNAPAFGASDPADAIKRSLSEGSKPDSAVTINREKIRDNRDTHANRSTDPVQKDRPKSNRIDPELQANPAVAVPVSINFQQELQNTLQQPLNPNILAVLREYPESRSRDALDALREAMASGNVRKPVGFFITAIRKGYKPKAARRSHPSKLRSSKFARPPVPDEFNRWFELALKARVAIASGHNDRGELMIYGVDSAESYEQVCQTWPLERLQGLLDGSEEVVTAPAVRLELPEPVLPVEEEIVDAEKQRCNALARLQAKFGILPLRQEAIAEAERWGFKVTPEGICKVVF